MSTEKYKSGTPQSIRQLMSGKEGGFGRVLERARSIEQLNQKVMRLLDKNLARGCRVENVREGKIIFSCNSSGVATRLRLQSHQLLNDLHASGMNEIQSVEIRMTMPPAG